MEPHQKIALLDSLEKFGSAEVEVGGWSMWPFIKNGDGILIEKISKNSKMGTVVAFFLGDQLIVHRVVKIKNSGDKTILYIRGDFSPGSGTFMAKTACIGTVQQIFRNGKPSKFGIFGGSRFLGLIWNICVKIFKKPKKSG